VSDALSDIARDERRAAAYMDFLQALVDYVISPDNTHLTAIYTAADECDSIPRGYWGGRTDLGSRERCRELAEGLTAQKPEPWAWLLNELSEDYWTGNRYTTAKVLSPWPNKKHCFVSYGRFDKGLNQILPMRAAGNGTTFDCNPEGYFEYVVFYDDDTTLRQMAESAVCIGIQTTAFYPSRDRTYIKPISHKLDYLAERRKAFGK
jgi:hypothetical protein